MDVTRDDVLRCARLTNLRLEADEVEPLREAMARILSHAQRLDTLPLASVAPTTHGLPTPLPRREDNPGPSLPPNVALANAPQQSRGHFRVPRGR